MPAGARISIVVLALPVKSAARAAFDSAPFVRSSRPRAVGAERQLLAGQQHERAGGRGRQGSELDFEGFGHRPGFQR